MLRLKAYLLKALLSGSDYVTAALASSHPAPPVRALIANIPYGPHRHNRLDVIVPTAGTPRVPVVFVHGGGWVAGHKSIYTAPCLRLADEGYCIFNINYRLGPFTPWP